MAHLWRARLERELAELDALLQQTAQDSAPVVLDQQSVGRLARMDAMRMQAMAQETQRRRVERRPRIEAALRRIDEGEFGFCIHLFAFVAVVTVLLVLDAVTGGGWWVQWVVLGWGIGLAAHAVATFWRTPRFVRQWERRKLRQLIAR